MRVLAPFDGNYIWVNVRAGADAAAGIQMNTLDVHLQSHQKPAIKAIIRGECTHTRKTRQRSHLDVRPSVYQNHKTYKTHNNNNYTKKRHDGTHTHIRSYIDK